MKEELNISEILKDKPKGTKLYTDAFGELSIEEICAEDEDFGITLLDNDGDELYFYNNGKYNVHGEPILVPSKEMRDWRKFAWKRGDVLVSNNGSEVLFEKFNNDEYTEFIGRYVLELGDTIYSDAGLLKTSVFKALHDGDKVKDYIAVVEKLFGGKLNRETLEIEKPQPEFKDGDIVVYGKSVAICRKIYNRTIYFYVSIDETFGLLSDDNRVSAEGYRFATEAEKQRLFDALAKEGKCWNAEKKIIEDAKKEHQFKPFDTVVVRDKDSKWTIDFYSFTEAKDCFVCVGGCWENCLPYNGKTAKLLGTTKDVEG